MVDRIMAPLKYSCTNPQNMQICYLTWKWDLEDVVSLRSTKKGHFFGLCTKLDVITKDLINERGRQESQSQRRCDDRSRGEERGAGRDWLKDAKLLLALKMEEEVMTQGMKMVS